MNARNDSSLIIPRGIPKINENRNFPVECANPSFVIE